MHLLISVNAKGNTMTPEAIIQSAVGEMYKFCTDYKLRDDKQTEIHANKRNNRKCKDGYSLVQINKIIVWT
ncbi:16595_t:CDS:2 [Cetraspora pellucida]|uniref:16595_t:CDS:1 n=1 Tax=Cetraspora pellucida TaxID=1433469 RepID=A0ACA9LAE1_9GLOM|nr:16595_t:CDS:2 [Cetraspora pellucida]